MKLNADEIIEKDLREKLETLRLNKITDKNEYLNLAKIASKLQLNFNRVLQANLAVLRLRKLNSNKDIIRLIWDLEYMNFN